MSSSSTTISKFFRISSPTSKRNDDMRKKNHSQECDLSNDNCEVWEKPIGLTTDTPIEIESDDEDNNEFILPDEKTQIELQKKETANESIDLKDKNEKEKLKLEHFDLTSSSSSSTNPFSQFAFGVGQTESSYFQQDYGKPKKMIDDHQIKNKNKENSRKPSKSLLSTKNELNEKNVNDENSAFRDERSNLSSKKKKAPTVEKIINKKQRKKACSRKETSSSFISIHNLSLEEKTKLQEKWHSFADPMADNDTKRFQILIAARLHTQSHEKTVRKTMCMLRSFFSPNEKKMEQEQHDKDKPAFSSTANTTLDVGLNPKTLSDADPEIISNILSSVLFANVKSRQIIQAAKDVQSQFNGRVPESQHGLKSITGIGPRLADLLSYVIRYSAFTGEVV